MRKKIIFSALATIIMIFAVIALSACDEAPWKKEEIDPNAEYTVRYTNGVGNVKNITVKYGEAYSIDVPYKQGYIFKGLYDSEVDGIQYVSGSGLSVTNWNESADRNLYTQWTPKTINFIFDANGGTGAERTMSVLYDSTINAFPVCTKTGYKFKGWFENGIQYSDGDGNPVKPKMTYANYERAVEQDEQTFYAEWEAALIPVTFCNLSNMSNAPKGLTKKEVTINIPYGSKIDDYIPSESGFDTVVTEDSVKGIIAWSTSSSSETEFVDTIPSEGMKLYAIWAPAIVFWRSDFPSIVARKGELVTLPKLEEIDDTEDILSWLNKTTGKIYSTANNQIPMPESGGEMTALILDYNCYSVNLNPKGGKKINQHIYDVEIYTPLMPQFEIPANYYKENYEFAGWYDNEKCDGEPITHLGMGSGISGELTLYAKWTQIDYTIVYHYNGGVELQSAPTKYTAETLPITLPNGDKMKNSGKEFAGWYDNEDFQGNAIETIIPEKGKLKDIELYAKWKNVQYTVTYNYNGGTTSIDAPTEYNVETTQFALPNRNNTEKYGYDFKGWFKNEDFVGDTVIRLGAGIEIYEDLDLYAKWELVEYTIVYHDNGGTRPSAPTIYTVETPKFDLPNNLNMSQTDKEFFGWYKSEDFKGNKVESLGEGVTVAENLELYAKWGEPIKYSITYNCNGGAFTSEPKTEYTTVMSRYSLPSLPKKDHLVFDGWYKEIGFSGDKITYLGKGVDIRGNLTLYAKWKCNAPTSASAATNATSVNATAGMNLEGVSTSFNQNAITLDLPDLSCSHLISWVQYSANNKYVLRHSGAPNAGQGDTSVTDKMKVALGVWQNSTTGVSGKNCFSAVLNISVPQWLKDLANSGEAKVEISGSIQMRKGSNSLASASYWVASTQAKEILAAPKTSLSNATNSASSFFQSTYGSIQEFKNVSGALTSTFTTAISSLNADSDYIGLAVAGYASATIGNAMPNAYLYNVKLKVTYNTTVKITADNTGSFDYYWYGNASPTYKGTAVSEQNVQSVTKTTTNPYSYMVVVPKNTVSGYRFYGIQAKSFNNLGYSKYKDDPPLGCSISSISEAGGYIVPLKETNYQLLNQKNATGNQVKFSVYST